MIELSWTGRTWIRILAHNYGTASRLDKMGLLQSSTLYSGNMGFDLLGWRSDGVHGVHTTVHSSDYGRLRKSDRPHIEKELEGL